MSERNKATQSYRLKPGYQWGDEDAGMVFFRTYIGTRENHERIDALLMSLKKGK